MQQGVMLRLAALRHNVLSGEVTWLRYLGASVVALAADTGSFMVLLSAGLAPVAASAIGYCLGIAVHWLVSSRAVFAAQTAERGPERDRQKLLFVGSALAGLLITTGIVGGAAAIGFHPLVAKAAAIVISFQTTYLLRRQIVFNAR